MTDTIPDHVGREAVRLLNEECGHETYAWPLQSHVVAIRTVAKLLMDPPAPMTDPDEEAAKRVCYEFDRNGFAAAAEQMRKEREAWEAGR